MTSECPTGKTRLVTALRGCPCPAGAVGDGRHQELAESGLIVDSGHFDETGGDLLIASIGPCPMFCITISE
ncbi:hypothetical protein FEAC_26730 [Ferrimicrobium acidiphilum DSM 19497]|uniref:Uncharacterized protein n=1 Tax=Ferrimicrobium acidiphilum DSM 19497 TaxID=1121877 RepID=A0A0D8FR18_9ACTN|nr:hypothetical protein FEAC_26730 [Ferrimicrobium acidiphilum DSM 19497]MCL5052442.1 hypothetical protein [Gammaproteobacteria bacterium]